MNNLQLIKISSVYGSTTNVRTDGTDGPEFNDLEYRYAYLDWQEPIKEKSKEMSSAEKLRFIVGIMLERSYGDERGKAIKQF